MMKYTLTLQEEHYDEVEDPFPWSKLYRLTKKDQKKLPPPYEHSLFSVIGQRFHYKNKTLFWCLKANDVPIPLTKHTHLSWKNTSIHDVKKIFDRFASPLLKHLKKENLDFSFINTHSQKQYAYTLLGTNGLNPYRHKPYRITLHNEMITIAKYNPNNPKRCFEITKNLNSTTLDTLFFYMATIEKDTITEHEEITKIHTLKTHPAYTDTLTQLSKDINEQRTILKIKDDLKNFFENPKPALTGDNP